MTPFLRRPAVIGTTLIAIAVAFCAIGSTPSSSLGQSARRSAFAPEDTASAPTLRRMIAAVDQRIDSLELRRDAIVDSLAQGGVMPIPRARAAWPFAVALPAIAYLAGARDHDVGGYADSFAFHTDKVSHCQSNALLTAGLTALRVNRWKAAGISALSAVTFEMGQKYGRRGARGYASAYDASYGAACSAGFSIFSFAVR